MSTPVLGSLSSAIYTTNATAWTHDYTVPPGANRLLTVRISALRHNSEAGFTLTCSYGSASLTELVTQFGTSTSRAYRASFFYLMAPAESTDTITVTSSATLGGIVIAVQSVSNVYQVSPFIAYSYGGGANPVTTFNHPALFPENGLVMAVVAANSSGNPTWTWTDADQQYQWNSGTSSNQEPAGSGAIYQKSNAAVTLSAERTISTGAQVGVSAEIYPAPAAAGGQPARSLHQFQLRR